MVTHVERLIAVLLAAAAIVIPIFNFAPKLYQGFLQSACVNCIDASGSLKMKWKHNLPQLKWQPSNPISRTLCGWPEFFQCGILI
jgi:hypothetical protein